MNCAFSKENSITYLIAAFIAAYLVKFFVFKKTPYLRIALVATIIAAIRYLFYFCTI